MNPLTVLKWLAGAVVAGLLFVGGCSHGEGRNADEVADLKAEHAKVLADVAKDTAAASEAARAAERAVAVGFAKAEQSALERIANAKESAAADTRDCFATGKCRLRKSWACPAASLPGTAADPGQPADGAGLRTDAVGRVLGIGRTANEYIALCVATLRAERVKVTP